MPSLLPSLLPSSFRLLARVCRYGPGDPVPLYGALPYILTHGASSAAGVLWLNAADTHVDIWRGRTDASAAEEGGSGDGAGSGDGVGSAWLSEGGAMELLFFAGPTARHVLRQLAVTTGRPPLPPLWSLGYHQSHWNVKTQQQVTCQCCGWSHEESPPQ